MSFSMATAQFLLTEIVGIFAYVFLNRSNLRFGKIPTVLLLCVFTLSYFLPGFPGSEMVVLIYYYFMILTLVKENAVNTVTLQFTYYSLGNLFGNTVVATFYSIYSSMHGGLMWLNTGNLPITIAVTVLVLAGLCLIAGLYIANLLKPTILNFTGGLKVFACTTLVTAALLSSLIKPLVSNIRVYTRNPYGIGIILDSIGLAMDAVVIIMIVFITIRNKKQERRIIEESIDREYEAYKEIEIIQSDINILSHDLRNMQNTTSIHMNSAEKQEVSDNV